MSRSTYSLTRARRALPRLVRRVEEGDVIAIARGHATVAYLLSSRHLERLAETIDLVANPRVRRAVAAHRAGRTKLFPVDVLDHHR
jgi:prevent-host-death family protein